MRVLAVASLAVVVTTVACGRTEHASITPTGPTGPSLPLPTGATSGRIENPETVADLITYNQAANVGLSTPVEGVIQRTQGIITRWELPIPVYVAPSIVGDCAAEAMNYWQSVTGLPFAVSGADAEPRITVRAAGSDELNLSAGSGFVYRTYDNNRARLAVVKILTSSATCTPPSTLFRHELGHAIGIFRHRTARLVRYPIGGTTASQREINHLQQLYRLPHGTRIEPDGAWRVVQP